MIINNNEPLSAGQERRQNADSEVDQAQFPVWLGLPVLQKTQASEVGQTLRSSSLLLHISASLGYIQLIVEAPKTGMELTLWLFLIADSNGRAGTDHCVEPASGQR